MQSTFISTFLTAQSQCSSFPITSELPALWASSTKQLFPILAAYAIRFLLVLKMAAFPPNLFELLQLPVTSRMLAVVEDESAFVS